MNTIGFIGASGLMGHGMAKNIKAKGHPLGQTLIVTAGRGFVQSFGGPAEQIRPGDVVWCPPGEKHWHGAAPTTAMTHIAIVERLDGKSADWMEKVSDEEYAAAARLHSPEAK